MKKFTLGSALIALTSFSIVLSDVRYSINTAGNTVGIFEGKTAEYATSRGGNFIQILDSSGKAERTIKGFREAKSSLTEAPSSGKPGFIGFYIKEEANPDVPLSGTRVDLFLTSNK